MAQTSQYTKILLSKKIGKEVRSYSDGYGTVYDANIEGGTIIDSLGNVTFTSPYKGSIFHIFKNRFVLYAEDGNNRRRSAVIDEKGNQVIPIDDQDFNTPWLSMERIISSKEGNDTVYDYNGKQIIPAQEKIRFAGKDRFFILKDKKWFLYDLEGKSLTDRAFTENHNFEDGRALISNDAGQREIIDKDGKTLYQFSKPIHSINAYPYLITKNKNTGKYGLVDTQEKVIAEEIYSDIKPEYFDQKEYVYLKKSNKITIFNKKENKLYPTNFNGITPLFNDLFITSSNTSDRSGIINLHGEIIVPQEYNFIRKFKISGNDFIYLKKGKTEQLLDHELKNILDPETQIMAFYPESLIIKKENAYYRFSILDRSSIELKNIVSIKEQSTDYFNIFNPYSKPVVCRNSEKFYGIINEKGESVVPFIYEDIIVFENSENEIVVKKDGKYGVTNYQNEPLKDIAYDKYLWQKEALRLEKSKKTDVIYFTRFRSIGASQ